MGCPDVTSTFASATKSATAFDPKLTCRAAAISQTTHSQGRSVGEGLYKKVNENIILGFVTPEGGKNNPFVRITAPERAGLRGLQDSQAVSFDSEAGRDGLEAAITISSA